MSRLLKHESYIEKSIGIEISALRKRKRITSAQLGGFLNISQQNISRYERGVSCIKSDVLIYILYLLKCPIDDFFYQVSIRLKKIAPKSYKKKNCFLYQKDHENKYFKVEKNTHFP